MYNHAQTILHEIPLQDEPTDTPKQMFTVQKITLFKNNSTFFIIKMKYFSIDHNSSSVDSWQIVFFQKCHDDIMSVSFLKTWKCPKSKTHGEFQLNGFQLWPPLTNLDNFWQKLSEFERHVQSWTPPEIQKAGSGNPENLENAITLNLHKSKGKHFLAKPCIQTYLDDHTSNTKAIQRWCGRLAMPMLCSQASVTDASHAQCVILWLSSGRGHLVVKANPRSVGFAKRRDWVSWIVMMRWDENRILEATDARHQCFGHVSVL